MQKIEQNKIFKIIWMVMALHILNFSIDAPDVRHSSIAEDLSYNEIESFTELIAEKILNIENAFSESDELGDEESGYTKKTVEIKFYHVQFVDEVVILPITNIKNHSTNVHYFEPFCASNYISIFSPPPEA